MKLSTRTRYGLRALAELALLSDNGGPVGMRQIAKHQAISKKYLENIFTDLRTAGFIRTVRGASGGYALAVPPEQLRVDKVVSALEGGLELVCCVDHAGDSCSRAGKCAAHDLWQELSDTIIKTLSKYTLADLAEVRRREIKKAAARENR